MIIIIMMMMIIIIIIIIIYIGSINDMYYSMIFFWTTDVGPQISISFRFTKDGAILRNVQLDSGRL
jgi:hypothetical protein